MAQALGVDFDAYDEQRSATPVSDPASLLVMVFDGTGVHMRPEGLREETRELARNHLSRYEDGKAPRLALPGDRRSLLRLVR